MGNVQMIASDSSNTSGYQAPAVRKAFQLLRVVAKSRKEPGLSELARNLGFSKSTTHGLIKALLKEGALDQSPDRKKFYLGPTIVDLAFKSWNYLRVGEKAQPSLDELRDNIGETVFLGVLSSTRGIIIATAEATKPLKISSPAGTTIPLLAGSVGKIFLARLDDERALRYIRKHGLPSFTPQSIVKEGDYLLELDRVRKTGYALDNEEYLPGVKAVAVNLGNRRGLPLAIWVVGFAGSMKNEVMPRIIDEILHIARKLESVLDGGA
jgi:DNA-binding IclR family transcriptional regulator